MRSPEPQRGASPAQPMRWPSVPDGGRFRRPQLRRARHRQRNGNGLRRCCFRDLGLGCRLRRLLCCDGRQFRAGVALGELYAETGMQRCVAGEGERIGVERRLRVDQRHVEGRCGLDAFGRASRRGDALRGRCIGGAPEIGKVCRGAHRDGDEGGGGGKKLRRWRRGAGRPAGNDLCNMTRNSTQQLGLA